MLATAPDALEADFQRFYGLDTDLIWTGELPANLAAALAANLPRQAIIWQKKSTRDSHGTTKPTSSPTSATASPSSPGRKPKEASRRARAGARQLQRPGTVRHEATGGEVMAMDDEQLNAYLAAPRTTIREA